MILRDDRVMPAWMGLIFLLWGCDSTNGFRFAALYEAPRSGFRVVIFSRGYIKSGDDIANKAFARVRVCPAMQSRGREFRFALTRLPAQPFVFDGEELSITGARWSEELLRAELEKAEFREISPLELSGMYRVISNSLSGPKGVILKGQIDTVVVQRTDTGYGENVDADRPPSTWVDGKELPSCTVTA